MEFFYLIKHTYIYLCCIRNIFIVVLLGMVVSSKPTLFPFLHSLLFLCDKVCKYVCTFIAGIFLFGYSLTSSFNTVPPLSILKLYFLLWACELRSVVYMIVCLVLYPRPVRNATVPCDWLRSSSPDSNLLLGIKRPFAISSSTKINKAWVTSVLSQYP